MQIKLTKTFLFSKNRCQTLLNPDFRGQGR